jgi:adenylate cyclase
LGDGVMATFGAVVPSQTYARDAMRAIESAIESMDDWNAQRVKGGELSLTVNASAASGHLIFAAVGDDARLEYTVIGDTVNLAAKLEKHSKFENARAITSAAIYDLAHAQGFQPHHVYERRRARQVDGVGAKLDLVVVDAEAIVS